MLRALQFFLSCFPTMATELDKDYCHDEDTLLRENIKSSNAAEDPEKAKNSSDSLAAMIANKNQTIATMAGNISSMGNALKRMHADTVPPSKAKRQKTTTAHREEHSDESGDESADSADSSALLWATRALQGPALPKSLREVEDPSTSFSGNICQGYDAEEKTSGAVTVKLAEFVNKRFSAKLGDGKYKEKFDKYGRPSNCDKGKPQQVRWFFPLRRAR